jgi:hypothetical protein
VPIQADKAGKSKKTSELKETGESIDQCPDWPAGASLIAEDEESPDFRYQVGDRILGLEVQTYYRQPALGSHQLNIQIESFRNIVASKAQQAFESKYDIPLQVSFYGQGQQASIPGTEMSNLASALAEEVALCLPLQLRQQRRVHASDFRDSRIGELVHSIIVIRLPDTAPGAWSFSGNVWPTFDLGVIETEIRKKERLLKEYRQKCNEVWLLLVVNDPRLLSTMAQIPVDITQHQFASSFDRVDLHDRLD